MVKIAHIADTHIKNLKYHKEYREVFSKIYDMLREEEVDFIIHCGDIAHTKTQLSPEYFSMCSNFLSSLADIAPTHVVLGNHDGNLKNGGRLDAVTPVAEALEHSNLFIYRNSQEVELTDDVTLNVLSVFDKEEWTDPTDNNKINIALFHGSVSGCKTDLGWTMENGEIDLKTLQKFDYALLGDIHKTNQILDEHGRVRYCGSTVQQNFGETNDKGFLIWDIESKEKYECKHYIVRNPKPFVNIILTPKGRIPNNTQIPPGARIKLKAKNKLPVDVINRVKNVAMTRFKPEALLFDNSSASGYRSEENNIFAEEGNLRDVAVQEKLIREFLADYHPSEELLQEVFRLNKKYNEELSEKEDISRYVNWSLKSLEWDNFFNFGEGNSINFNNLNGVVGIFGKNYSGKSSVVESLLYTMYNYTTKKISKSVGVVNQQKDEATGRVKIQVGDKLYSIERVVTKYNKKLHGNETIEAKTALEFSRQDMLTGDTEVLNGTTRNKTDENIKKHLGAVEDFLITSMSSQTGALSFVEDGNKNQKGALAKFLDLTFFEKKYKLAHEEASDTYSIIKKLEQREYDFEIEDATISKMKTENSIREQKSKCKKLKKKKDKLSAGIFELKTQVQKIPEEVINVENLLSLIEKKKIAIAKIREDNKVQSEDIKSKRIKLTSINEFSSSFAIEQKKDEQVRLRELKEETRTLVSEYERMSRELALAKESSSKLKEVPCGDEFSHCKFIRDAYVAQDKIDNLEPQLINFNSLINKKHSELEKGNLVELNGHIERYKELMIHKGRVETDITKLQLSFEKNSGSIKSYTSELEELNEKLSFYNENKQTIDNLHKLKEKIEKDEEFLCHVDNEIEVCEEQLITLHKQDGTYEEKIRNLEDQKQQLEEYRKTYSAYDLFKRCMDKDGISYKIIKNKLPIINEEISKVLSNIVDFEVFFENSDDSLEINIKHPKFEPRPLSGGSGAEKTLAAMSIRLALLNVSSLPKGDVFILDEPGTALDEENMEGFTRIIDMVKSQFKNVILISHLDSLKDCVDTTIDIDKVDGFAHINS